MQQADCLHNASDVETALEEMARAISRVLADCDPLLVCLMNGALVPFGILLPKLQFPLQVDYIHATRYGDRLQGGELKWIAGPFISPQDRTILLIVDIQGACAFFFNHDRLIDCARTLAAIIRFDCRKGRALIQYVVDQQNGTVLRGYKRTSYPL